MRKKIIVFIIFFIIGLSSLFAERKEMTKSFQIQGAYGAVTELAITPIPAQSQNYRIGMPFNVEDVQVQSSQKAGRKIAEWSLISNTKFILKVKATKLTYNGESATAEPLDYVITFAYRLTDTVGTQHFQYNTESGAANLVGSSEAGATGEKDGEYTIIDILGPEFTEEYFSNSYIGILNESIYFKFTQSASAKVQDDNLVPPGEYSAAVTLLIEGE